MINIFKNLRISNTLNKSFYSTQSPSPKNSLAQLINSNSNFQTNSLNDPLLSNRTLTAEESWSQAHQQRMRTLDNEQPLSLYSGRTVVVGKYDKQNQSSQLDKSWKRLNGILARNDVRRELILRDRYEKPNQMRRRLRSERHRRRFAEYIRQKVNLVNEIRRRNEILK